MAAELSHQDIQLLASKHHDAVERMQCCLRKDKYRATKNAVVKAWHTYSVTADMTQQPAPEQNTSIETPSQQNHLAWLPLPDDDIALLAILKKFMGAKVKWHYYVVYFVCYVIVGLLLASVSQFLIYDEAFKRVSSRLSSPAIGATFYPAADEISTKPKITVLAIDDKDLEFFGKTYPLPYAFHAQMLDRIGILSPKAIFIDIWFHDERDDPSISQLVDTICRLHREGTRVYLASLSSHDAVGPAPALRSELRAITVPATGPHSLEQKPGACAVEVAVGKEVDSVDRQTWRYDLATGASDRKIFSAAAQIYNDLPGHAALPLSAGPLALIWGVKGAEINRRPPGFNPTEDTGCRNTWHAAEVIPVPVVLKQKFSSEIAKPFCTYHPTLPFSALRKMPSEALQPLIEDRLIVYGGNLQSMDDVLYSPVHGRLAGLHMHAMALDNLLYFGEGYPVAEEFSLEEPASSGTIFPLVVVVMLALFATLIQWNANTYPEDPAHIPDWFHRFCTKEKKRWQASYASAIDRIDKKKPVASTRRFVRFILKGLTAFFSWLKAAFFYLGLPAFLSWVLSWTGRIILAIAMLFVMAWIGLRYFHLGPLSWMEYAISPIAMEFLHIGKKVAHYIHPKLVDLFGGDKK